jgi:nucleoside-triphosphatase THEP1
MMVMKKSEDREKINLRIFWYTTQQQVLEKQFVRAIERAKIMKDFAIVDKMEAKQEQFSRKIQEMLGSPQAGLKKRGSTSDDPIDGLVASIGIGGVSPSSPMETPIAGKKTDQ